MIPQLSGLGDFISPLTPWLIANKQSSDGNILNTHWSTSHSDIATGWVQGYLYFTNSYLHYLTSLYCQSLCDRALCVIVFVDHWYFTWVTLWFCVVIVRWLNLIRDGVWMTSNASPLIKLVIVQWAFSYIGSTPTLSLDKDYISEYGDERDRER